MKQLVIALAATTLLMGGARYGRTEPAPATAGPTTDRLEAAKQAESKGDLARRNKNFDAAASYYFAALRVTPHDPGLYNKVGIVELQLHDHREARKDFKLALKNDPRSFNALNNLGAVEYLDGKYKPAVNYLKQALALDESSASAHINLAEAWIGMKQIDRAMTEYARALELDADILESSMDGIQARVISPGQRARVSYTIAKAYARRGNVEGALEFLRRAKDDRFPDLANVYTDQDFASLWNDPRLGKLIKR
jgi:tetratricopeptide (TPR) repeat protein